MNIELTVKRIKTLCQAKGFKMKFLCGNLGVRDNYFTDCKNKNVEIPIEILKAAATMLETTVAYILGESDDPHFYLSSVGMTSLPYEKSNKRPIFGHASAGLGVLADQQVLGYEAVSPEHDGEDFFWLQVNGDSMSPEINNNDLVLVQKDCPLESNTLMVVIIDDSDGFIKKVSIDEDTVTLHSYNPYYPPMVFGGSDLARLRFIGKVIELKRKF